MMRVLLLSAALLSVAPGLGAGTGLSAQGSGEGAFVIEMGTDTFAVENFTRSPDEVSAEIGGLTIGRMAYRFSLGPEETVTRMTLTAWPPGAPQEGSPVQEADLDLRGDSVIVRIETPAGPQTQRLGSTPGAIPYLNPSFILVEQAIRRSVALGGETVQVPLFMVQGGQTIDATIRRLDQDSVSILIGGSEAHARIDREGGIIRAAIPAQNLQVTRIEGRHVVPPSAEPPDYSAPEGAPYLAREVQVETAAGHVLAGTLTLPPDETPLPAAVLITGSGAQDRDQAIPLVRGYRPFREIADMLSRNGVAVLRLDDRGFGASTGEFASATSEDFAEDIREAVRHLRELEEIDADRVFLVGHSEGGIIAPMLAADDPGLAGIVLVGTPAWTGREIVAHQQRYAIESAGTIPEEARDSARVAAARALEEAAAGQPWLHFFLEYDPLPTARRVSDVPVLILHGETDRQVPVEQAEPLAAAFREGSNPDVTVRTFPAVNHLMLTDPDGNPMGYASLQERRLAPGVLEALVEWVSRRAEPGGLDSESDRRREAGHPPR